MSGNEEDAGIERGYDWLQTVGYATRDQVLMMMWRRSYLSSGNPVLALEAIWLAWRAGLVPPPWAFDLLGKAIDSYLKEGGRQPLDKLLGLVPGVGETAPIKRHVARGYEQSLMIEIRRLRDIFGMQRQLSAVCRMVAARLDAAGDSEPDRPAWSHELGLYRRWNESKIARTVRELAREYPLPALTDEEKADLLKRYPRDSIPQELRKKHLARTR
jgi:hypothetical protein